MEINRILAEGFPFGATHACTVQYSNGTVCIYYCVSRKDRVLYFRWRLSGVKTCSDLLFPFPEKI